MIEIDSDDDGSRTPSPPPSDDDDFWPEHGETAYRVYHDLWEEFYSWESEYCLQTISKLSRFPNKPAPSLPDESFSKFTKPNVASNQDAQWFTIQDYDPNSSGSRILTTAVCSDPTSYKIGNTGWQPYARYTSCTPASRNVLAISDVHARAHFAPYADDAQFDQAEYLKEFEDFMWQNNFIDPDLEMIQLEATRRLYYIHKFTFSDIDKLGIFAFPMRKTSAEGLIWYSAQRDSLRWPGSDLSGLERLPTDFVNPDLSLYEDVTRDLIKFCPRQNCLRSFCRLHHDANPVFPPKPTITNQKFKEDKSNPCNDNCYKTMEGENINMDWSDTDRSHFDSILRLAPDTHPCDLAILCRKPCAEVYIQRLNTLSDEDIAEPEPEAREVGEEDVEIEFVEDKELGAPFFSPVAPCYHEGPCNRISDCPCYKAKQRCQRSCRCSMSCKIRWKGCNCTRNRPCGPDDYDCPCRVRMRECEPDLCVGCCARGTAEKCLNTDLQKGRFQRVEIKRSKYGLGAFAVKTIPSGKYIGEYVGERYSDEAYAYMHSFHEFTGLNYAFDLEADIALDSWTLGNETRYLDHSSKNYNAKAQVLFVHGEHRIVLSALKNIQAGKELLLDYGPTYWNNRMPDA
ncbi:hypothetical protein GALMADRAFT_155285 [Galerina marginata CBS 339.88]|uniref:SET domain-containing protein n=1 Tax=Galerina marginata (strain CBS 339.88) TaxID=685588 RepID=A0A067T5C4_GALM3|nr:hypothetical protein GALMADRAFT_155285 [Galerina marginata CBS 339.88]